MAAWVHITIKEQFALASENLLTGDYTEKIWAHRFLASKPNFQKHIALFKLVMYFMWMQSKANLVFLPDRI